MNSDKLLWFVYYGENIRLDFKERKVIGKSRGTLSPIITKGNEPNLEVIC